MPWQTGFTLVETLVTLAMLGAGTLVTLSLMQRALAERAVDLQHTRAQRLLADAGELIATLPAADAGGFVIVTGDPGCMSPCLPAELAAHLMFDWRARVATALPAGVAGIALRNTGDEQLLDVQISWADNRGRRRSRRQSFALRAIP